VTLGRTLSSAADSFADPEYRVFIAQTETIRSAFDLDHAA